MNLSARMKGLDKKRLFAMFGIAARSLVTLFLLSTHISFAAGVADSASGTLKTVMGYFIEVLGIVCKTIGGMLAAWGFVMLIMSARSEDASDKVRSCQALAVGVILIAMPSILNGINFISLVTG